MSADLICRINISDNVSPKSLFPCPAKIYSRYLIFCAPLAETYRALKINQFFLIDCRACQAIILVPIVKERTWQLSLSRFIYRFSLRLKSSRRITSVKRSNTKTARTRCFAPVFHPGGIASRRRLINSRAGATRCETKRRELTRRYTLALIFFYARESRAAADKTASFIRSISLECEHIFRRIPKASRRARFRRHRNERPWPHRRGAFC